MSAYDDVLAELRVARDRLTTQIAELEASNGQVGAFYTANAEYLNGIGLDVRTTAGLLGKWESFQAARG